MNKVVPRKRGRPPGQKNHKRTKFTRVKPRSNRSTVVDESDSSQEQPVLPWFNLRRVETELLPRMSALASNPDEEAADREDLNSLQLELETLLSAAAVRRRQLEEQVAALQRCEKKAPLPRLAPRPSTPTPRVPAEPPTPVLPLPPPPDPDRNRVGPPRGRHNLKKARGDVRSNPDTSTRAVKPCARKLLEKNHTPHKFWLALDPYCDEPSEESLALVQDLICHNQMVVPKLLEEPPLGEHYSNFWDFCPDDVKNMNEVSSTSSHNEENDSKISTDDASVDTSTSQMGYLSTGIGSVVKRKLRECTASIKRSFRASVDKKVGSAHSSSKLTSSILQGGLNESKSEYNHVKAEEDDASPAKVVRTNSKYLSDVHSQACTERKLRLHNEAAGEVPVSPAAEKASDSVMEELRRAQAELRTLSEHNNHELMFIAHQLQVELSRQKLITRLRSADNAIVDIYQARTTGKLNKNTPTPQETTKAWRALANRNEVLHELDCVDRAWHGRTISANSNTVLAPAS